MLIYPRWFAAIAFEHWTTRIRATFHVLLATFFRKNLTTLLLLLMLLERAVCN